MKKIALLFLLIIPCVTFAQNTVLKFKTSKNISVNIHYPIDQLYNSYEYEQIKLYPNKISEYKVNIDDFCYIEIRYSDSQLLNLIVTEGNELEIEYNDGVIYFSGVDGAANQFNHNNHTGEYVYILNDIFARNCSSETIDMEKINKEIEQSIFLKYYGKMKGISFSKKTEEIIKNNFKYHIYGRMVNNYKSLLMGVNGKITPQGAIEVKRQIQSIFKDDFIKHKDIFKYSHLSNYISSYYYSKAYFFTSKEESADLMSRFNFKDFGPFAVYLTAPKEIQSAHFAGIILFQLQYNTNELDNEKVFEYIKKLKPESEYIPIIEKRLKEHQLLRDAEKPQFISGNITSLKMLSGVRELRDKYLYIDIWATWCLPCRTEFTHHKELKKMLSKYSNLAPVYISIDNDKDDAKWRADVLKCHLVGYNIRATQQLTEELERVLCGGENLSIPRYILLNPQGEIIDTDLPRPSNMDELLTVLEKMILFSITIGEPKSDKTNIFKL